MTSKHKTKSEQKALIPSHAIRQAENELRRANQALARLMSPKDLLDFRDAWDDFLHHTRRLTLKLELGCRSEEQAKSWYGRVRQDQRQDDLLCYLLHARNAEQHGLETTLDTSTSIGARGSIFVENLTIVDGKITSAKVKPLSPGSKLVIQHISVLVPVKDGRSGTIYNPPRSHLGEAVADQSPLAIATLAIKYYADILEQASNLR